MADNYYKTEASVKEYIELAKDVNGRNLIEKLRKVLHQHSSLLEIGSGPGTDWKILNETYKVTGSDNSQEFLKYLKADNPQGDFLELDALSLATDKKFDGIYSNKVLHHLKDHELVESIGNQQRVLNPGGIICHSFWSGEGSEIFKGLFVNYHNEMTLRKVYENFFEVLSVETYKEFDAHDSLYIIGKKK
ncbi:class I SAM-dependent methyltransferase [Lutimonas sp.]|uniref:class I SAM-dependent methyltransferase n=1 Tax=Lutimonas sp. TaxID=1872403 RepID=UPI003D9B1893